MAIPEHVKRIVETKTGLDLGRGAVGPTPRPGRCRTCRANVLRGLDDEMCASIATVDPVPLNAEGQAGVLLAGRATYRLLSTPKPRLVYRETWDIPGTSDGAPVVADHVCGNPVPARWRQ